MTIDEMIATCEEGSKATWNGVLTQGALEHHQLAEWLKELKSHREAWKTVLDDMMNVSIPGQDAEYVYEEIYDIINKYRPKEGDAE